MNSVWKAFLNAFCWFVLKRNGKTLFHFCKRIFTAKCSSWWKLEYFRGILLRPWHIWNFLTNYNRLCIKNYQLPYQTCVLSTILTIPLIRFAVGDCRKQATSNAELWNMNINVSCSVAAQQKSVWDTNSKWLFAGMRKKFHHRICLALSSQSNKNFISFENITRTFHIWIWLRWIERTLRDIDTKCTHVSQAGRQEWGFSGYDRLFYLFNENQRTSKSQQS